MESNSDQCTDEGFVMLPSSTAAQFNQLGDHLEDGEVFVAATAGKTSAEHPDIAHCLCGFVQPEKRHCCEIRLVELQSEVDYLKAALGKKVDELQHERTTLLSMQKRSQEEHGELQTRILRLEDENLQLQLANEELTSELKLEKKQRIQMQTCDSRLGHQGHH